MRTMELGSSTEGKLILQEEFTAAVQAGLAPLLNGVYEDVAQLDSEIELVAGMLVDAAIRHLPLVHPKGRLDGGMVRSAVCVHKVVLLVQLGRMLVVPWRVHYITRRVDYAGL